MSWSSKAFYEDNPTPGIVRELAIVAEVLKGNVPSWMFKFLDVKIGEDIIQVAPDYLSIGTDTDYVRTPLTPLAAQGLADHLGYTLPTKQLVDEIWKQSVQIAAWIPPFSGHDNQMRLGLNYLLHSTHIDGSIHGMPDAWPLTPIAGHKKDVISNMQKLQEKPHHVVIYGWFQPSGTPIQPVYNGHDWFYEDYSHGIRFVKDPTGKYSGRCALGEMPWKF